MNYLFLLSQSNLSQLWKADVSELHIGYDSFHIQKKIYFFKVMLYLQPVCPCERFYRAYCVIWLHWMMANFIPVLSLFQNSSEQTVCSSVKGKKGSIYNRIRAEGSYSSDRGYYSFGTTDAISGKLSSICLPHGLQYCHYYVR